MYVGVTNLFCFVCDCLKLTLLFCLFACLPACRTQLFGFFGCFFFFMSLNSFFLFGFWCRVVVDMHHALHRDDPNSCVNVTRRVGGSSGAVAVGGFGSGRSHSASGAVNQLSHSSSSLEDWGDIPSFDSRTHQHPRSRSSSSKRLKKSSMSDSSPSILQTLQADDGRLDPTATNMSNVERYAFSSEYETATSSESFPMPFGGGNYQQHATSAVAGPASVAASFLAMSGDAGASVAHPGTGRTPLQQLLSVADERLMSSLQLQQQQAQQQQQQVQQQQQLVHQQQMIAMMQQNQQHQSQAHLLQQHRRMHSSPNFGQQQQQNLQLFQPVQQQQQQPLPLPQQQHPSLVDFEPRTIEQMMLGDDEPHPNSVGPAARSMSDPSIDFSSMGIRGGGPTLSKKDPPQPPRKPM
jgi:hypothetical protein